MYMSSKLVIEIEGMKFEFVGCFVDVSFERKRKREDGGLMRKISVQRVLETRTQLIQKLTNPSLTPLSLSSLLSLVVISASFN